MRKFWTLVSRFIPDRHDHDEARPNLPDASDGQPLTRSQRMYWASWKRHAGEATDNRVLKVEWNLDLDTDAFRRALEELVRRTDALRLTFHEIDGEPSQQATDQTGFDLTVRNFSAETSPSAAANDWLDTLAHRRLDLQHTVFETALARLAPDRWIWFLNQHHVVTDHTSVSLIVERLSGLYEEALEGQISTAAPYPSFLDFLRDNPGFVKQQTGQSAPPVSRKTPPRLYATDHEKKMDATPSTSMLRHEFHLGKERLTKLNLLTSGLPAGSSHRSRFEVFTAAVAAFVARTTGQNLVTIGTPSHNRFLPASDKIAGLFFRVLRLQFEINETATFRDLLQTVQDQRQQVFSDARSACPVPEHRYNTVVNYIPHGMPDFCGSPSLDITETRTTGTVGVDLGITVRAGDTRDDIKILFDINRDVADITDVTEASGQFLRLFDAFLDAPDTPLMNVAMGGSAARRNAEQRALIAANAPAPDYSSVPEIFLKWTKQQPDSIAVSEGSNSLTYAELETRSREVACALVEKGAKPGMVVVVHIPRSIDLVVALFGVLRSGAAFYVLEKTVPEERAGTIISDTGASIAISLDGTMPVQLPEVIDAISLDQPGTSATADNADLPAQIDTDWPMYVMYTSGSTGLPKGVVISHGSFSRYIAWQVSEHAAHDPIVWAFATTLSFESPLRMFSGIASGGSIRVYREPEKFGDLALADVFREDAVDGAAVTPSELRLLIERNWPVSRLRTLVVIGEPLQPALALAARQSLGSNVSIQNWYGPTEATMASTMHRFNSDLDTSVTVPVGSPAPDVAVHILDSGMNPLPDGMIGEIFIGGQRLSDGYLNQPKLTRQLFVPDPFCRDGTLYRTGDLGRVNSRGELVHHGRNDDQIKINGVRIEYAEVERAILHHPTVTACAAILNKAENPSLIAGYVAADEIPATELRAVTRRHALSAAVPNAFFRLASLPMNQNGKVDRAALLRAAPQQPDKPTHSRPRSQIEDQVAEIWREILTAESIGPEDDFFELGGDSLSLVRMVLLVENRLGITLDAESADNVATISDVVALVREAGPGSAPACNSDEGNKSLVDPETLRRLRLASALWSGERVSDEPPIFHMNAAGQLPPLFWCFNGAHEMPAMATAFGEDRPVFGMKSFLGAVDDQTERQNQLRPVAQLYASEIERLHPDGPYLLGGNCQGGKLATEIARVLIDRGYPVPLLCLMDTVPVTPYPGRISLFFGEKSDTHNPFKKFSNPEAGWQRLFREVTWDIIPGKHAQYFKPRNVGSFCQHVTARLKQVEEIAPVPLPPSAFHAGLEINDPMSSLTRGQTADIPVSVRNLSRQKWWPGEQSGLYLASRWFREDGSVVAGAGSGVLLDRTLGPNETCEMVAKIQAPNKTGRFILEFDMCEQGITWFSDRGSVPYRSNISVTGRLTRAILKLTES